MKTEGTGKLKRFKTLVYKALLRILNLHEDYRGLPRMNFGISTYPRQSPLIALILNAQEVYRACKAPRFDKSQKKATQKMKDSKTNKVALVLGNGPSLNKLNYVNVVASCPDIWVVNNFYQHPFAKKLNIAFYALSDMTHLGEIRDHKGTRLEKILEFVNESQATLVLPHWMANRSMPRLMEEVSKVYFDDREISSLSSNIKPTHPRGYMGLTLYKALAFAKFLGYREIYILGFDGTEFMGYKSDEENRILLDGNHANGIEEIITEDWSDHFLDGMASALLNYARASHDLTKFRGNVVNLDSESLCTAFPKNPTHDWVKGHSKVRESKNIAIRKIKFTNFLEK